MTSYRDLDKQGSYRMVNIYMGPTLGWCRVPVSISLYITDTGNYTVQPWDTILLINQTPSAAMSVLLPKVSTWLDNIYGGTELIIKDYAGVALTANITLQPYAGDSIIGPSVIQIGRGSLQITPNPDRLSWTTVAGIE